MVIYLYGGSMENGWLEFRKREIKRAYKRYIKERTDKEATIADVAAFFEIDLQGRLADFYIVSISFDEQPALVLVDDRTHTVYEAKYTSNARLLNTFGGPARFISVVSKNEERTVDSLYLIVSKQGVNNPPLVISTTFKLGNRTLTFTKENKYNVESSTYSSTRLDITYKAFESEAKRERKLLCRSHERTDDRLLAEFDYETNFDFSYQTKDGDEYEIWNYSGDGGVLYAVEDRTTKDETRESRTWLTTVDGFCIENIKPFDFKRLPIPAGLQNRLQNRNKQQDFYDVTSWIFFCGIAPRDCLNEIEVTKRPDGIHIEYSKGIGDSTKKTIDTYTLPNATPGNISLEETDYIIRELSSHYPFDEFISIVIQELSEFKKRMMTAGCPLLIETDELSPRVWIDISQEAMGEKFAQDREAYFDLAERIYEKTKDLSKRGEVKPKDFQMKPKDQK